MTKFALATLACLLSTAALAYADDGDWTEWDSGLDHIFDTMPEPVAPDRTVEDNWYNGETYPVEPYGYEGNNNNNE